MEIDIKNNSNYFWRIIFTFFIAYIHSAYRMYTNGWYLCVDFFFFSSGFVLAMSRETDTLKYIWRRTKKLWPHLFLSYVMVYAFCFKGGVLGKYYDKCYSISEKARHFHIFSLI